MSTVSSSGQPTVYLHVGAPKTGTTFLQEILWAHRDQLARDGVLLPGTRTTQFHATLEVREVPLDRHPPAARGSWSRLVDEALSWDGTVVLSHELFAGASVDQARRAVESLRSADVHIIYTARDLARQIPAEWQEHVKHRSQLRMDEFVREVVERGEGARWFWQVQDPAGVLGRWGASLPSDHVHVVTVPPAGADFRLLWVRFACLLGINPSAYDTTAARPNVSLGAVEAELVRRLNTVLGDRLTRPGQYPRLVKETLAHDVLTGRPGQSKFGIRPEWRPWLVEKSKELIADIDDLGVDVVGDASDLLPDNAKPLPADFPDDVDERLVSNAAVDTVVTVLERLDQEKSHVGAANRERSRLERVAEEAAARVTDLEREIDERRKSPIKKMITDLSERHAPVMGLRRAYWKAVNTARLVGRTSRRPVDGGGAGSESP